MWQNTDRPRLATINPKNVTGPTKAVDVAIKIEDKIKYLQYHSVIVYT